MNILYDISTTKSRKLERGHDICYIVVMSDNENYRTLPDNVLEWPPEYRVFLHPNQEIPTRKENESDEDYRKRVIKAYCDYDPERLKKPPEFDGCLYAIHLAYAYARTYAVAYCAVLRDSIGSSSGSESYEERYIWEPQEGEDLHKLTNFMNSGCFYFSDIARIAGFLNFLGQIAVVGNESPAISDELLESGTETITTTTDCDGTEEESIEGSIAHVSDLAENKLKSRILNSLSMPNWNEYQREEINEVYNGGEPCLDHSIISNIFERSKVAEWRLSYFNKDSVETITGTSCSYFASWRADENEIRYIYLECSLGDLDLYSETKAVPNASISEKMSLGTAISNTTIGPYKYDLSKFIRSCGTAGIENLKRGVAKINARFVIRCTINTTSEVLDSEATQCIYSVEQTSCEDKTESVWVPLYGTVTKSRYYRGKTTTNHKEEKIIIKDITLLYDASKATDNLRREGFEDETIFTEEELKGMMSNAAGEISGTATCSWLLDKDEIYEGDCYFENTYQYGVHATKGFYAHISLSVWAVFCDTPYLRISSTETQSSSSA